MDKQSDRRFPLWVEQVFARLFYSVDKPLLWHWDLATNKISLLTDTKNESIEQLNSWNSILTPPHIERLLETVTKATERGECNFSLTCAASFPGRASIPVSCHGSVVKNNQSDTNSLHILGFFRELRHGADALHGLQGLPPDAAQTRLLANMSHEIRTPLNGILGMVELALDSKPNQEIYHYLQGVRTSSMALLQVLNGILDYSKLSSGYMTFQSERFLLRHLIREVLDLFSPDIDRKGLEFLCVVQPDIIDELAGDSFRIRQILLNIVGNAVKFTHTGRITLRIEANHRTTLDLAVHFSIEDTGIGIPQNQLESIFVPFMQVDSSTTRRFGGTGLGLSICKALTDGMGGKISVESTLGIGSTFRLSLPLKIDPKHTFRFVTPLTPLRILISMQSFEGSEALQKLLSALGYAAICCTSIEQTEELFGAAHLNHDPFDIWLLDSKLAQIDDGVVLRRFRHCDNLPAPELQRCILISTALRYSSDTSLCETYGISTRLRSPWLDTDLVEAIRCVMSSADHKSERILDQPQPDYITIDYALINEGLAPIQEKRPSILLVDDDPMNLEVLQLILKRAGFEISTAENGEDALERFEEKNFDLVIMDIQMPIMDGITATEAIRLKEMRRSWVNNPFRKPMTIIGLTADVHTSIRSAALEAGMNEVLVKPTPRDVLITRIREHLAEKAATR